MKKLVLCLSIILILGLLGVGAFIYLVVNIGKPLYQSITNAAPGQISYSIGNSHIDLNKISIPEGIPDNSLAVYNFRPHGDANAKTTAIGFSHALADQLYCAPTSITQLTSPLVQNKRFRELIKIARAKCKQPDDLIDRCSLAYENLSTDESLKRAERGYKIWGSEWWARTYGDALIGNYIRTKESMS